MARRKDKERRGTLRSHLRELRIRLSWSAGFLVVGTVVGWFLFDPVFSFLQEPLKNVADERGIDASANFTTVVSAFDLRIQLSIFLGVIITSPVWLWNIWAFVAPGLKEKEKRYAIGFMVSALPLFLSGTILAWASLPGFVVALIGFTPEGSTNVINAADYVLFAIRILLIFGIAFVMPVILVLMNFAGLATGRGILKSWRVAVLIIAIVAALATPVAEPMTMQLMMVPLMILYFGAVGIAMLNDKRRERKQEKLLTADELELD